MTDFEPTTPLHRQTELVELHRRGEISTQRLDDEADYLATETATHEWYAKKLKRREALGRIAGALHFWQRKA